MDFIAAVAMLQSTVTYVMEAITFCWSLKDKENTCSEAADDGCWTVHWAAQKGKGYFVARTRSSGSDYVIMHGARASYVYSCCTGLRNSSITYWGEPEHKPDFAPGRIQLDANAKVRLLSWNKQLQVIRLASGLQLTVFGRVHTVLSSKTRQLWDSRRWA